MRHVDRDRGRCGLCKPVGLRIAKISDQRVYNLIALTRGSRGRRACLQQTVRLVHPVSFNARPVRR